ncbi:MAG: hypothetical protein ACYC61_03350 [Isosphaeraceae bacterium]
MMTVIALLVQLVKDYKTYSPVLLAIGSGLGMIMTKGLGSGIPELFQVLSVVFSGASLVGLRTALARIESLFQASPTPAPAPAPAPAADNSQPAKAS